MKKMLVLIAGPVRSGTEGNDILIKQNLNKMEEIALNVYKRGHIPVIGEWLALPLSRAAGSQRIGDKISEEFLYPVAHQLIQHCDAILRIPGASSGADNDVRIGKIQGLAIYTELEEIPIAIE